MKTNIPILYYHFVQSPPAGARIRGLFTNPKQFKWQIDKLRQAGFHFITFADIAENTYNPAAKNVIITFDDGCESVYNNAFPVLKAAGAKAVFYIVADAIGDREVVWEQNENKVPLNIVSRQQMLEMSSMGIEIGSHLCHHVHLTGLNDEEKLEELCESKRKLEAITGKPVYSVAYPFGSYDNITVELTRKAGYKYAVTTRPGNNTETGDLELFRYVVKGYALKHYWYFMKLLKKIKR